MGTMLDTCSISPESAPRKDSYTSRDTEKRRKKRKKRHRKRHRKTSGSSTSSYSSGGGDRGYSSVDSYSDYSSSSQRSDEGSNSMNKSPSDSPRVESKSSSTKRGQRRRRRRHSRDRSPSDGSRRSRKSSRKRRRRRLSHSHSHSHTHRSPGPKKRDHRRRSHSHRSRSRDSDGYLSSDHGSRRSSAHDTRSEGSVRGGGGRRSEAIGYMMVPYTLDDKGRPVPMFGQVKGFTPLESISPLSPISGRVKRVPSPTPDPLKKIGSMESVMSVGDESVKSLPISVIVRPEMERSMSHGYNPHSRPSSARENSSTKRYSQLVQSRKEARKTRTARRSHLDSPIRLMVQPPTEMEPTLELSQPPKELTTEEESDDGETDLDEHEEAEIAAIVKQREKTRDSRHPTPGLHLMTTEELFAGDDLDIAGASVDGDENIALTPRAGPVRTVTPEPSDMDLGASTLSPHSPPGTTSVSLDQDDLLDDPNFRKLQKELSVSTLPLDQLNLDSPEELNEKQESSSILEVDDSSIPRTAGELDV